MSLEKIGQLAVDLHAATLARKHAKDCLRDKYAEFCREWGICDYDQDLRYVRNDHPAYPEMQAYAAEEVKAYARAKLDEFNVKRKLYRSIRSKKHAPTELERFAERTEKVLSDFLYGHGAGDEGPLHDLLGVAIDLAPPAKRPQEADAPAGNQIDMDEVWHADAGSIQGAAAVE